MPRREMVLLTMMSSILLQMIENGLAALQAAGMRVFSGETAFAEWPADQEGCRR